MKAAVFRSKVNGNLRVRSRPNGAIVDVLKPDVRYSGFISEPDGNWRKIRYEKSPGEWVVGYSWSEFLEVLETPEPSPAKDITVTIEGDRFEFTAPRTEIEAMLILADVLEKIAIQIRSDLNAHS